MGRMTVTVDDHLVEEARDILQVDSKSEAIRGALEELLRHRKLRKALEHAGRVELALDQKELARLRAEP